MSQILEFWLTTSLQLFSLVAVIVSCILMQRHFKFRFPYFLFRNRYKELRKEIEELQRHTRLNDLKNKQQFENVFKQIYNAKKRS